jgi:TonB family protein
MISGWNRAGLLFLAVLVVGSAETSLGSVSASQKVLEPTVTRLRKAAVHNSQLAELLQAVTGSNCELTRHPEALTTPDPLMEGTQEGNKITVSFIIGTDGMVHSPLILESAGQGEDENVLQAVRSWRYRPAMCNGVPMEAEAKIEFSNR